VKSPTNLLTVLSAVNRHTAYMDSVDDAFLRSVLSPSVRPAAVMSSRHGKSVPKSYRIYEFRNARCRRQSRSPWQTG
jgi:hypothetical protein